jgi:hypothetical protein
MSVLIYKEENEITITGYPSDLEALASLLLAKAKLGENLSATLISDEKDDPNIRIEILED